MWPSDVLANMAALSTFKAFWMEVKMGRKEKEFTQLTKLSQQPKLF